MDAHRIVIAEVVEQHVEEAASLADLRRFHVRAPHVNLEHLGRLDERLAAHLDGIAVAGDAGWKCSEEALAAGRSGNLFAAAVPVIQARNEKRLQTLLALAEASADARAGFLSALGWASADDLRQVGSLLLSSANPFSRYAGIVGCSMHGLDPGLILSNALKSPEPLLRARAYRAAGELGREDLLGACTAGVQDADEASRSWAAWSAVRLGNRETALDALMDMYRAAGKKPENRSAVRADLVLLALDLPRAHALLSEIARDPSRQRHLIAGAGLVGDSIYIPWLIEQMAHEPVARLAGEAFTLIAGADLEALDLEKDAPDEVDSEPNDDAESVLVDMDPDDGLPWPDAAKVAQWWAANKARFASGVRTLIGEPLSADSCLRVLRLGYQRQRRLAALHRALQNPSGPIFECRAPASQQLRALG